MTARILFVSEHIHFPQGGGGAERNTHELCLALLRHGIAGGVMCALSADRSWLSYRNRLIRKLRPGVGFPRDDVAGYPVFRGWNEDGVVEVVRRFRPDAAIVQGTHPERQLTALRRAGVPAGVYIHEVVEVAHLAALAGSVRFLANSGFTAGRLLQACGIEANVVLPLVEPSFYQTQVKPQRVLFVNTVPRKGLEIAFRLAESRPDIPFDFVRGWILRAEQRRDLERRARQAGNITVHEPTGNMRRLYARTRVLLAPSQWEETWGRVVTEAHINGIPVLASNTGGLPESVGPAGITLDPDAPLEAWQTALSALWDRPEEWQRLSEQAKLHAQRDDVRPDRIVQQVLAFVGGLTVRDG
jgi:glycosyltransferase involved in cell wall biosynthesis